MIRPMRSKIVAVRVDSETVTRGGILIPDTAQTNELICTVTAIGPDVSKPIDVGVMILVGKYLGTEVELDHCEMLIIEEEDVHALVIEEAA